jgi:hypothetical protein
MRRVALVALLLLAGCGGHKSGPTVTGVFVPKYPGSTAPKTTQNQAFTTFDFALPAGAHAETVYDWYVARLTKLGWKVTQRNETGVHAEKSKRTIDVGVRGRTLEINQG